jgi:hypothetical protein
MNHFRDILSNLTPLLIIIINSCSHQSDDFSNYIGKSTKTILINTARAKTADFSDLFEITRAIRLATNDSVIIGRIDKIRCVGNKFYILDGKTNYIDVFDFAGRFLFKISAIGEGYGKYFRISDFDIDPSAGLIYLLDDFKRKLILFSDFDGHFVTERPLFNFTVDKFLLYCADGGQHFIYSRGGTPGGSYLWYNVLIADTSNHVLEHFLPYRPTGTFILSPVQPLQRTGNSVSYLPPFSNTIFEFTSDQRITAKYVLDFSGSNSDFEGMQATLRENKLPTIGDFLHYLGENNYIEFLNFLETDSCLFVFYTTRKFGNQFLIYQKKADSSLLISTIHNNYFDFSAHLAGVCSDQLITLIEPDSFLDKEKVRLLLPPGDRALLDHFSAKDNPILVIIKPKLKQDETATFLNKIRKTMPNILVVDTPGLIPGNSKLIPYPYWDTTKVVQLSSLIDPKKKSVLFYFGEYAISSCDICMSEDIAAISALSKATGVPVFFITDDRNRREAAIFRNRHNLNNLFIFTRPLLSSPNFNRLDLVAFIN